MGYAMANQTIVVTNHDPVYLQMIQDLLEDVGYTQVVCIRAEEAYEVTQRMQPNVILLDIHVGNEAQGWGLLDKIRLSRATASTPVIICTTDPRIAQAKASWLSRQRCTILDKPFTIDDLLGVLESLIGPPARDEYTHERPGFTHRGAVAFLVWSGGLCQAEQLT
jgi:CheY-like chemotaxis protein